MMSSTIGALLLVSITGGEPETSGGAPTLSGAQDVPASSASGGSRGQEAASPPAATIPPAATPQETEPSPAPPETAEEIVVSGKKFRHAPGDPFERVNAISFELTQKVDDAVVGPAARAYKHVVPHPVRTGLRNFLNNLREPVVFVNYLLQFKPGKAVETVGRFALNSTLGVGGFIDVAKRCPFNLPWRPNGFSDTLGVYGIKEGPYLFVPLIGPTTIRELVGGTVDRVVSPLALGGPFKSRTYVVGSNIYRVLDRRAEMEDELQAVRESSDPYAARRDLYLKKRQVRVERLKGEVSVDEGPVVPDGSSQDPAVSPDTPPLVQPGAMPRCPEAGIGEVSTFAGPRAGVSIGLNRSTDKNVLPGPGETGSRKSGLIIRGTIGYDLPIGETLVIGAEVNVASGGRDIVTQRGTLSYRTDPGFTLDMSGRLGLKPSEQLLLFVKAGWAMQRVTTAWTSGVTTATTKSTEHGFLWGAGAEYALTPRTALRAEFDHVRFNDHYSRSRILSGISLRF